MFPDEFAAQYLIDLDNVEHVSGLSPMQVFVRAIEPLVKASVPIPLATFTRADISLFRDMDIVRKVLARFKVPDMTIGDWPEFFAVNKWEFVEVTDTHITLALARKSVASTSLNFEAVGYSKYLVEQLGLLVRFRGLINYYKAHRI
jgi:hypothetical protein